MVPAHGRGSEVWMSAVLAWAILAVAGAQQLPVVGGHQAPDGAWPDAAGVADRYGVICSGVLVAPNVVLTAGHCVETTNPSSPAYLREVVLDTNDFAHGGEVIGISEVHEHPQSQSTWDITALVLDHDASVEPRVIARGCVLDEALYDGADAAIVGYGAYDVWGTQYDSKLREAFTTITDPECTNFNSGCRRSVSPGGELGAGGGGIDACYGDSGGPLYLITEDMGTYVVGLTSRAYDTADKPCEDGGIYVRPDAVVDWIEDVTGETLAVPDCNRVPDPSNYTATVGQGKSVHVKVKANDPDQRNGFTWAVVSQPAHGTASISDDGKVSYTAPDDYLGDDLVVFSVTDDGVPSHTVQFHLAVTVVEHACGCATPGSPASLGLLALVALAAARRRR